MLLIYSLSYRFLNIRTYVDFQNKLDLSDEIMNFPKPNQYHKKLEFKQIEQDIKMRSKISANYTFLLIIKCHLRKCPVLNHVPATLSKNPEIETERGP